MLSRPAHSIGREMPSGVFELASYGPSPFQAAFSHSCYKLLCEKREGVGEEKEQFLLEFATWS